MPSISLAAGSQKSIELEIHQDIRSIDMALLFKHILILVQEFREIDLGLRFVSRLKFDKVLLTTPY